MVEKCSQSLWKIITGHSAIQETELILSEVKDSKELLIGALSYYRKPNKTSETKLKSSDSIKGKKREFVFEISKKLSLDELQSLQLFRNFLLEGYNGSFEDINKLLSNQFERLALLKRVEEFHHKERLFTLRCMKQILGYEQDGGHPYHSVYSSSLNAIQYNGKEFISSMWRQLEESLSTELPSTIQTLEEEKLWVQQMLLEQTELLEILVVCKNSILSASSIVDKINLFQKGLGLNYHQKYGRYNFDGSMDYVTQHINHLCSLIILKSFDFDFLEKNQFNISKLKGHPLLTQDYKSLEEFFYQNITSIPPLVLLGWSVLYYMTADMDHRIRLYGDHALQGNVFEFILNMLQSSFFSGDRPVSGVCKNILYSLVSLLVSLFNETSLGDYKTLLKVCASLLTHPRLRLVFWMNGFESGLGILLTSALKRVPFEVDEVIDILISLSCEDYSASNVHSVLLSDMSWFTEELPLTINTINGPEDRTLTLIENRTIFEKEYGLLGLEPLLIPAGTIGLMAAGSATGMDDETQIICWSVQYSAWNLFGVWLVQLLNTFDEDSQLVLIQLVQKVVKLASTVLEFNWSIKPSLQPLLSQLPSLLQKFSCSSHPPVDLITTCIECLSVMAGKEPTETWSVLSRTGFYPRLTYTDNKLQVSSCQYGNLLNMWERAHGLYPVTIATLHLTLVSLTTLNEGVVAVIAYLMESVFVTSHNWRYSKHKDKEEFCNLLMKLCHEVLDKGVQRNEQNNLQNLLHSFVVDVLLNSPGHTLLINILGIGVTTVNKLTTSSVNWGQSSLPLESLNICFKVINLLLQNKSSESITPFEQSLASTMVRVAPPSSLSVTSQQHIITSLATYAYHRDDPAIPTSAVQLLTRIAPIATMSMFSCLGNEAVALRDVFVTRLSTKAESTELKIAILDLITVSIGTQPGLLELLLSLEHSQSTDNSKENGGNNVLIVGKDSCLKFILEMISSSSHKTPPSLVSSGMTLLKTLWERRHVGALSALTATDDKFWEHLMAPVYEDMNLEPDGDQMTLSYKLHVCSEIFNIISMEVYYVIFNRLNGGFKSSIKTFVSKESYKKWCQVYQWCLPEVESQQSVSLMLVKSHHRLAESWRALLLVAISCHESLFGLENEGTKKVILQELLVSMEALTNHLPLTLPVLNELLSLYLCLLRKWTNVNIPCNVIERFSVMMDRLIHIDNQIGSWQTLPLVYSCLICIVTSLRRNEIDLERRFTQGLVPLIATTLTNYSQYLSLTNIKYYPETYSVYLLFEIMFTLENDHGWFRTLRDHSIVMILIQLCTGHIESLTHSGFVSACFSFFLTLSQLEKGAEVLMANDIFHMLSISLCIVVDALTPNIKNEEDPLKLSDLLPHPQWYNVWLAAIKLVTSLLCTKKHYVINDVINFVSAHSDRLLWVLDILIAVKYMEVLEESNCVCQFFKQLVIYRLQWRGSLFHQHNIAIERVLLLFHGAVTLLSRERVKDIVKTMDSQGFLSSNLSCKKTKSDNEIWIKQSPAYIQIKEKLFSIVTSCLVILNGYTPPLVDLFMCSLTSPLDLSEWPRLFQLVSTLPVLDLTCSPSISTLTNALSVGREILVKLNHPRSSGSNPSPFKSPPIKSPITPGLPRPHSAASQQKRNEILFMLEQTVLLLISQSLCYLYNEQVEVIEKQALKKQLVGELGSFCQVLLINFQRKGAPSPRSSSLSSSHQTLYESSSGRGSSHSFSESSEQGLFKIAELFYKSKILAR